MQIISQYDYKAPNFYFSTTDLIINLDKESTEVEVTYHFHSQEHSEDLTLNGQNIQLKSIFLNNKELKKNDFSVDEKYLTIHCMPKRGTLKIVTTCNPSKNTELSGLYISNGIFTTQCEAEGFQRITYCQDRPDILSIFTTTIISSISDCPIMLAAGNKIVENSLPNNKHLITYKDPHPKPTYLFAIVAGKLNSIYFNHKNNKNNNNTTIGIHSIDNNIKLLEHAKNSCELAFTWDEINYNRYYDLESFHIVAIPDFNMGAMENKGLNIFNSKYLIWDKSISTDLDYKNVTAIIAHEYFHNWTGNRITLKNWFQLSLKEGLTVFREQQFCQDIFDRYATKIEQAQFLYEHQFPEDASALAHAVRPKSYQSIDNFYTATVYEKGAQIFWMLKQYIGKDHFNNGIQLYFQKFDGRACDLEDFYECMATVSGKDLKQFMLWYDDPGTPIVTIKKTTGIINNSQFNLTITQKNPKALSSKPLYIPLPYTIFDKEFKIIKQDEHFAITKSKESISIPSDAFAYSFNQNLISPIILQDDNSIDITNELAIHDSSLVSRWNHVQNLYKFYLSKLIENIDYKIDNSFISTIDKFLLNTSISSHVRALMFQIPSVTTTLNHTTSIKNLSSVKNAYQKLRSHIAKSMYEKLLSLYSSINIDNEFNNKSIGNRNLKNNILDWIYYHSADTALELAKVLFQNDNITCKIQALIIASYDLKHPISQEIIETFKAKSLNKDLLLLHWFKIISTSPDKLALEFIEENILNQKYFNKDCPNHAYAVYLSFFSKNIFNFHTEKGYQLFSNTILYYDKTNGQIASRLASSLKIISILDNETNLIATSLINDLNTKVTNYQVKEILQNLCK